MHIARLAAAALLGLASAAPAGAAVISGTYAFTALGFGASAPVDPVIGSFSITFDSTVSVTEQTSDITLNTLNIDLGSALGFSYDASTDWLIVGGMQSGTGSVLVGTDDFVLLITGASTSPTFSQILYSQTGALFADTDAGSVTFEPDVAVPEPTALVLLATGLLGLGAVHRRRAG